VAGVSERLAESGVHRVVAHLFCLFLACPILNPAFGGDSRFTATTLYLYCVLPLLDPRFLAFHGRNIQGPAVAALMAALAALAALNVGVAIRMVALALAISYVFFLQREGRLELLGSYMLASAAVAMVQFALAIGGSPLAEYLYPNRMAVALWGDMAILARPAFEDGVLFPVRVAGLAREPSFFNLQALAVLFVHFFVARLFSQRWAVALMVTAVVLSFSKITPVVLVCGIAVVLGRRLLNSLPLAITLGLWLAGATIAVSLLYEHMGGPWAVAQGRLGETLLHRTIGYFLLTELNPSELVFGIGRGTVLGETGRFPYLDLVFGADKSASLVLAGSGAAQSVIEYGLVSTLVQMACAGWFGLGSAGLVMYLVFGLTMSPLVVTSHGVIAGFLALSLGRSDTRVRWWVWRRQEA